MCWYGRWTGLPSTCLPANSSLDLRKNEEMGNATGVGVLDAFRREHNYVHPHEALAMQTPATRSQPSSRRNQPNPPPWEHPEGTWLLKIDCQGKLDLRGRKWLGF